MPQLVSERNVRRPGPVIVRLAVVMKAAPLHSKAASVATYTVRSDKLFTINPS